MANKLIEVAGKEVKSALEGHELVWAAIAGVMGFLSVLSHTYGQIVGAVLILFSLYHVNKYYKKTMKTESGNKPL